MCNKPVPTESKMKHLKATTTTAQCIHCIKELVVEKAVQTCIECYGGWGPAGLRARRPRLVSYLAPEEAPLGFGRRDAWLSLCMRVSMKNVLLKTCVCKASWAYGLCCTKRSAEGMPRAKVHIRERLTMLRVSERRSNGLDLEKDNYWQRQT